MLSLRDMSITGEETHSKLIGYCLWGFGFTGAHRFYFGRTVSGTIFFVLSIITGAGFAFLPALFFVWPFAVILGLWWALDFFQMPKIAQEANFRYQKGTYNYSIAWLLHTYSGIFGAHRFYLGKWVTGLIYLFTGGLFGIGYFYDFLTLNDRVSAQNEMHSSPWWSKFFPSKSSTSLR